VLGNKNQAQSFLESASYHQEDLDESELIPIQLSEDKKEVRKDMLDKALFTARRVAR
jgi:hypothetical protein